MFDYRDNYYALMITIFNPNYSSDMAIDVMRGNLNRRKKGRMPMDHCVVQEMYDLRNEGMSYNEIAAMYGISMEAAWRRIHRYVEKKKAAPKSGCK